MTPSTSSSPGRLVGITWAAFVLLGWSGVLVPALVRQIETHFAVDDAAIGIYYFVYAAAYATSSFAGGLLVERLGRSVMLPLAAMLVGLGLLGLGLAPLWPVFVAASLLFGAGAGIIDGGVNGLALAIADTGRGRALNLLHLFYAGGAFIAPVIVGQLVERDVPSAAVFVGTGLAAIGLAVAMLSTRMPSGRRGAAAARAAASSRDRAVHGSLLVPLVLLAIAIGTFVASEAGVSNWITRFLAAAPVTLATAALSVFWGGIALGRLFAARYSDRFSHSAFAGIASAVAGVAVIVAVVAPTQESSIVAFAVAGFAMGPIFPMIVALGGELYPDRLAATGGTLIGAGVLGGMIYPPLIGLMSAGFGIATGLLGAAALSLVSAAAILGAARLRDRRVGVTSQDQGMARPEGFEPPTY